MKLKSIILLFILALIEVATYSALRILKETESKPLSAVEFRQSVQEDSIRTKGNVR